MRLSQLLENRVAIPAKMDCDIARLTLDSRHIQPNDLFIAIKGTHLDGRKYIPDAIARGAKAVLVDAENQDELIRWHQSIPLIPIFQLQTQIGELASRFYHHPAAKLCMVGVTGTSGKTSCTHFISQILTSMHIPCGLIGTLGSGFYGALRETGLTTPDAISLQATLRQLLDEGAKAVAMEVSSHSIDQGRVNGMDFEVGIFTNLSQDHLDYHGHMEAYAAVKRKFFAEMPTKNLIINAEDTYGLRWIHEIASKPVFAYSTQKLTSVPANVPLIYADPVRLTLHGILAEVHTPWGSGELDIPLIGRFNLSNALAVLTALCILGIPFSKALTALSQIKPVPGRMQMLGGVGKPLVVVDYAHKPDALEKVLQALRGHTQDKLICVFGCGGERDQGKRPLMAKIAEQLADQVIVTNDNPRHEKPEAIAEQIVKGFSYPERVRVMLDRSKAIQNSIQCASASDCILIAGKGAEHYQQIGDEKIPFDDVEQVLNYLDVS